jgi:peptide/histidine transporter 3/4
MTFYYLELLYTLGNLAIPMAPLLIAMGFYLSTLLMVANPSVTAGNINHGRLDNMYWTFVVAVIIYFGHFLLFAS